MHTPIYWITHTLAVSSRPRGGDWLIDELRAWRVAGVGHVISLLTDEENRELELVDETKLAEQIGLRFTALPIPDRGLPPSPTTFWRTAVDVGATLGAEGSVLAHCRQGIGRASLMAAALLLNAPGLDIDGHQALEQVERARGRPVPDTPQQRDWLIAQATSRERAARLRAKAAGQDSLATGSPGTTKSRN